MYAIRSYYGEGDWQRISWDQALDEVAEKLSGLKEKYGARRAINENNPTYLAIGILSRCWGVNDHEQFACFAWTAPAFPQLRYFGLDRYFQASGKTCYKNRKSGSSQGGAGLHCAGR